MERKENKDMILANKNVILNLVKKVDENTKAIEDLSTVAYSAYKGYENNIGKMRKENKRLTDISEENQQVFLNPYHFHILLDHQSNQVLYSL